MDTSKALVAVTWVADFLKVNRLTFNSPLPHFTKNLKGCLLQTRAQI